MSEEFQVAVVGGGINGAGVAREAAARGYRTLLIEKDDFGHATSGNSSKLIHGGIRYLEQGNFSLVREALKERRILTQIAPHLATPLRFNIPVYKNSSRPWWMVWIGTQLYDLFAGKDNLQRSSFLNSSQSASLPHLKKSGLVKVLQYSDAQTLDSRLTLETVMSARNYGASVKNYTELTGLERSPGLFTLSLRDTETGAHYEARTKVLVNAAGPWVPGLDSKVEHKQPSPGLRYVRGIHFVIRGPIHKDGFLILPQDGRVIFVLPWCRDYTLIGTTETVYSGSDFGHVPVSSEEEEYLFANMKEYFPDLSLSREDVLYEYSGVRSLLESGGSSSTALTRESTIVEDWDGQGGGYLAIFGGKLTTYRSMGVKVVNRIGKKQRESGPGRGDTQRDPLPGGEPVSFEAESELLESAKDLGVSQAQIETWKLRYGSRWSSILKLALEDSHLRQPIGTSTYWYAEMYYSVREEMARNVEDIALRRTKIIYELDEAGKLDLQQELEKILPSRSVAPGS
jgi:glycerol-3-phosphate dehydrogenase